MLGCCVEDELQGIPFGRSAHRVPTHFRFETSVPVGVVDYNLDRVHFRMELDHGVL